MKLEIVNGKIISVKGTAITYERNDGKEFTYNKLFPITDNASEDLIGKYLQVEIDDDPANSYTNEEITSEPVNK